MLVESPPNNTEAWGLQCAARGQGAEAGLNSSSNNNNNKSNKLTPSSAAPSTSLWNKSRNQPS